MLFFRNRAGAGGKAVLPLLLCPAVFAAHIPVTIGGVTQTQIEINYTATSAASCTISAVDNNNGPTVNDVDPAKFPGANIDLNRTAANGFRWPTIASGLNRTVFIGGHDEIKQGSDTKWYSTALQVNSAHTITVSCNGGVDTGTATASTSNLPIASYYPELKIPTPGSPMSGMPQFTVDWSVAGRSAKYIDPITGVLIERISGPTDNMDDGNSGPVNFSQVIDINGAWTNAGGAIGNANPPTAFATTSTPNAPLHVAFGSNAPYCCAIDYTDMQVSLYGKGSNGAQAEMCISEDGGQSCASGVIDQAFSTSSGLQAKVPTGFPGGYFSDWGGGFANAPFLGYDLDNFSYSGASATGSNVSLANGSTNLGFNLDRKPGSPFYLYNCSSGGPALLHVAHTDAITSLTTQESGLNLSNCTYQDLAAGLRIILKNTGTLTISQQSVFATSRGGSTGVNGSRWMCARSKVTDIATDCDGNTQSPPLSGSLCYVNNIGVFVMQDNGRACLQSDGYGAGVRTSNFPDPSNSGSPWIDNKSLLAVDASNTLWKLVHKPNDYTEYNPGFPHTNTNDNFIWTNQSTGTTPIATQITTQLPNTEVAKAINSGLMGNPSIDDVIETPGIGSGAALQYRWTAPGGGGDGLCMLAWADAASNNLISVFSTWNSPKGVAGAACHFTPIGLDGYSVVSFAGDADGSLGPRKFNKNTVLGGPFVSRGIGLHHPDGSFQSWTLPAITSATNTSPVVLTFAAGHDIDNITGRYGGYGAQVACSGGTGNWAALNGTFYAHDINDNNHAALYSDALGAQPVDSSLWGGFGGQTITCTTMPPVYGIVVSAIASNGGNARITASDVYFPGYNNYYPSGNLAIRDGDPITFFSMRATYPQFYAHTGCAGCTASQFDVYTDQALTIPASFGALAPFVGQNDIVNYSETCPDPATVDTSWFFADQGIGTPGNPISRCITIRLNSEPCSDFASNGEQATYPCPSDPTNTARSSVHGINVGDSFYDLSHFGYNHEVFAVIKKVKVSETQIDVTLIRDYGGFSGGVSNTYGYAAGSLNTQQHAPGWTLWQIASLELGIVPITGGGPTPAIIPTYYGLGGHTDTGLGQTPGNLTFAGTYTAGAPDAVVNVPAVTFFGTPQTHTTNNFPIWANDTSHPFTALQQSYSTLRQVPGVAPDSELAWNGNWAAMNIDYGNGANSMDSGWCPRTLSQVAGTNNVYKIQPCGTPSIKLFPLLVFNGEHGYFVDKSGPNSVLTDADLNKYCYAYNAGECVNGSSAGDIFASMRLGIEYGQCTANSATLGTACAIVPATFAGWAIQQRIVPATLDGSGIRRLTLGVATIPSQHYTFRSWIASPDAQWGYFPDNPVGGRPMPTGGTSMQWWAMKLPPWPTNETKATMDRTNLVPIKRSFGRSPGDSIRVAFGYGENGDPASLYCTTRHETCWTSASATPAAPFVFDSEPQQKTACDNGCTISIPAIAGRVLFFRIERSNGSDVRTGPLEAVLVP